MLESGRRRTLGIPGALHDGAGTSYGHWDRMMEFGPAAMVESSRLAGQLVAAAAI